MQRRFARHQLKAANGMQNLYSVPGDEFAYLSPETERRPAANCGCSKLPRRVCDICDANKVLFVACSRDCLERHHAGTHADQPNRDVVARALGFLTSMNARGAGNHARYAVHRERTMQLVPAVAEGATIGIYGAGDCSDVDLEGLARRFRSVHLIDLDGEALERARSRQHEEVRRKLVLHPGVDVSGVLCRLDEWGESFPERAKLERFAVTAARNVVATVGRTFDVTLSCCVLSQLVTPFHRAWVMRRSEWNNLVAMLRGVHLSTLAGTTCIGGTAILTFDVLSSADAPRLAELDPSEERSAVLQSFVETFSARGGAPLDPLPHGLLEQVRVGLASLTSSPRLSTPWLWDINGATQLVYGLVFERTLNP